MEKRTFVLVVLSLIGGIIAGCGTFGKPVEEFRIIEGQVDNVVLSEVADKKDFLSVTHVGFANGQGISLIGAHPGLSKGKTVKLKVRFYKEIRGTLYYKQMEISTSTPSAPSEPKQPTESKQPASPEAPHSSK